MLKNGLSTFKFLNSQKAGDFILAENIKLIDAIKEINCRKNKLLISAIEPALKNLRIGGENQAGPIPRTGSSRLIAKQFYGLPK